MWFLVPALLILHLAVCGLLVLVVLMQLPRSEGLGAAFGGSVTENIFGAQATSMLAKFTVWLGIAFFVVTLALAVAYSHLGAGSAAEKAKLMNTVLPTSAAAAASASPAASASASPLALPSAAPSVAPATVPVASPAPAQP